MKKVLTLCLVYNEPRLLLGMKKRGFGAGKWNGFGGKVGEGESVEGAAQRELKEEAGISALSMEAVGVLNFYGESVGGHLETYIFRITDFEGEPIETAEMEPRWFHKDELPFDKMWPDDRHWLPLLLAGKKFNGSFYFKNMDTILKYKIEEM